MRYRIWLLLMTQQLLDNDEIITELDISHLVIEDDTPVDNFQSEEQQRLLVEALYSSKVLAAPFLAAAHPLRERRGRVRSSGVPPNWPTRKRASVISCTTSERAFTSEASVTSTLVT